MSRSCQECLHRDVCKFIWGEMIRRKFFGSNFIKELKKLKEELARGCKSYLPEDEPLDLNK